MTKLRLCSCRKTPPNRRERFCRTARYALFIWMFVYEFLYSDGVMCV